MQYICLIYTNEADDANITKEQETAMYAEYSVFGKKAREAGAMVAGEAFHPTDQAKTVQVTNGKTTVSNGPAVSTPIQLGGMYILEAPTIDKAAEWAAMIPGAKHGKVEVRPLVDFSAS